MSDTQSKLLFVGIALAFLIWGALGAIIGPLLPEMTEAFSLSSAQAGFVFIPWSTGFSIGALTSQRLLHRYKIETLLAAFAGLSILFCIALFFCNTFIHFLIIFSLLGSAGGATFTLAHTFVGQTFTKHRVAAISSLDLLFSFGNVSAPLLLVLLLSFSFGWQSPFLFFALACSICLVIYTSILLLTAKQRRSGAEVSSSDAKPLTAPSKATLPIGYLIIPAVFMGAFEWGQSIWFVSYSIDSGASETAARIGQSVFLVGMISIRILTIAIGQRSNDTRLVRTLFAFIVLGNLMIVLTGEYYIHLVGCFIAGAGVGAMFPIILSRAMEADPARSASYSVTMILCITVGGQLASLSIGTLADYYGIANTFRFTTIFGVIFIIGFEFFWRRAKASIAS